MVFWTNYPKCFLATFVSLVGGFCGLGGVLCIIGIFTEGLGFGGIVGGAICIALFFGFRSLADKIAENKYRKMAEQGQQVPRKDA